MLFELCLLLSVLTTWLICRDVQWMVRRLPTHLEGLSHSQLQKPSSDRKLSAWLHLLAGQTLIARPADALTGEPPGWKEIASVLSSTAVPDNARGVLEITPPRLDWWQDSLRECIQHDIHGTTKRLVKSILWRARCATPKKGCTRASSFVGDRNS